MDPANRNTALASVFADELARSGVALAVICPGSRSTPLALALDREERIRTEVILDERSAGFAALGAALGARAPTAVLTTSGTAAANLHPAVAEADESGVPLIVLTADRPPELRGIGAGQTIDQIKLYGAAVRWFCEVGTHEADDGGLLHYRSVACRAAAYATDTANPGPVHLNMAWREPLAPNPVPGQVSAEDPVAREGRSEGRPLHAVTPRPSQPSAEVIDAFAGYTREIGKGVILAGRQADPGLAAALLELSQSTGFPVLAEPTSQARNEVLDQRLISGYEWIARLAPVALRPDLVIRFGEFPTSKALRSWLDDPSIEQVTVAESGWNDPANRTSGLIRAAPVATARALADALGDAGGHEAGWLARWRAAQASVDGALDPRLAAGGYELGQRNTPAAVTEPALHRALGEQLGGDDLVYTASSMPIRDQEAFARPTAGAGFLANRGANGIDGLVSAAIGAGLATGRPVWAITGDLGLVHDTAALQSVRLLGSPLRILVVNNAGGAIFEHLPQAKLLEREEFERLFITPSGVDLVALSAAHGLDYIELTDLAELGRLDSERCLVELRTDGRADAELRAEVEARTRDALVDALAGQ